VRRIAFAAFALFVAACGPVRRTDGGVGLLPEKSTAPAFSAPDQNGHVRTLEEFKGRSVVLYFYPRDATPGCTAEACAFRDSWTKLEAAGAQVLGVSTDDVASHAKFANEHKLPFPLLADPEKKILRAYGVDSTLGLAKRVTFVIDRAGVVAKVFPDVDPALHANEVSAVLESLK
jgi:thioredoxin-dependent peroxiredoxin